MAGPSFHDGSGSLAWAAAAIAQHPSAAATKAAAARFETVAINVFSSCSSDISPIAQLLPAPLEVSLSITWSMPKLAAFWRGGNSLKLCSQFAT